ncbi:hypothetical protein LSH36_129g01039 [Paralvinella palmiformis]|uniref:Uncharacterized protein n=1 Tax=Paralvinella palmiformis TaxID=53620 RepID=A0AAD9JX11_9ANNE|nr:hypothetical protein LSH36_129g01039 [Paralvinella palmiformis]
MEVRVHNLDKENQEKTSIAEDLTEEADLLRQQLRQQDEHLQKTLVDGANKVKAIEDEFYKDKQQMQTRLDQMQQHVEQVTKQSNMADSLNANMADILKEKDETIAQLEEKMIELETKMGELSDELHMEVEENNRLHGIVNQGEKEKENLQKQTTEMQNELTEVEEEYSKLANELRDMNKQLSERDTERELLTQDLKRVETHVKQLEEENKELQDHAEEGCSDDGVHLKQRCTELCDDLDKANNEIFMLSDRLETVEKEKEAVQRINDDALTELDQLRSLYEVALRDLNESQNKTSDFEEQIKNKNRQHHSDLQAKEQEIHDLQFEKNQYKAELDQMKKKLDTAEAIKAELTQQLEAQKLEFQSQMEVKYNELSASKKMVDEVQNKLKQTEASLAKDSQFLAQLSKSAVLQRSEPVKQMLSRETSLQGDIPSSHEDLKNLCKKLGSENRDLKHQLSELTRSCEEADSANTSLKQHLKNLESGYQGQVDDLGAKVQELTTQLSNMERRKKRLERRTRSQEIFDEVDKESQTDFEHSEMAQEHLQKLQNELDISDTKVNQLMDRLMQQRNYEVELELLQQRLASLESENSHQKEQLSMLSALDNSVKGEILPDQLCMLQLKLKQSVDALDDCSGKLSVALASDNDGHRRAILETVLQKLSESRVLLQQDDQLDNVALGDDVELQLFSERLALEAVILGEMSYLVRSEKNENDQAVRDLHLAKLKVAEITSSLYKQFFPDEVGESDKAAMLSVYASLLAEKMRVQTQLLLKMDDAQMSTSSNVDVFVSDNKRLEHVAHTALNQSALSLYAALPSSPVMNSCFSVASVQTDLAILLNSLREHSQSSSSADADVRCDKVLELCREITMRNVALQQKFAPVIKEIVREVTKVLLECDRYGMDETIPSLELFSEELRHITKQYLNIVERPVSGRDSLNDSLYKEAFVKHLNQTVDEHIHKLLEDIENTCKSVSVQELKWSRMELEQARTQSLLQLGYLLSQMSFVQALATYFISNQISDSQTTSLSSSGAIETTAKSASLSSLSSPSSSTPCLPPLTSLPLSLKSSSTKTDIATLLAREAASRNDLASFLHTNASRSEPGGSKHSCQDQITSLSSRLLNLDLRLLDHHPGGGCDYAALLVREAVTQAQLSYVIQYLKLKHETTLERLKSEMVSKDSAAKEAEQMETSCHEEEIQELSFQLESAHKQRAQVEDIAADLESELQRKENNFRQEVQALKDGYDIRIRSLQADLDVAKQDLEKLQQERELEGHQFEESLHASIIEYETKIEKMVNEKENELANCAKQIEDLEERLSAMKVDYDKLQSSTSEDGYTAKSLSSISDDSESGRERIEEIDTLRQQLEEEKKRHIVRDIHKSAHTIPESCEILTVLTYYVLEFIP